MVLSTLLNLMKFFSSLQDVFSWRYGPKRGLNLVVHCKATLWTCKPGPKDEYSIELAGKLFQARKLGKGWFTLSKRPKQEISGEDTVPGL